MWGVNYVTTLIMPSFCAVIDSISQWMLFVKIGNQLALYAGVAVENQNLCRHIVNTPYVTLDAVLFVIKMFNVVFQQISSSSLSNFLWCGKDKSWGMISCKILQRYSFNCCWFEKKVWFQIYLKLFRIFLESTIDWYHSDIWHGTIHLKNLLHTVDIF